MRIGHSSPASKHKAPVSCLTHAALQRAENGTVVERWVDDDVLRPDVLEEWRRRGDPLADSVVKRLKIDRGIDALECIEEYLALVPEHLRDPVVTAFWDDVARPPPVSVSAQRLDSLGQAVWTPDAAIESNNCAPEPTLDEGQAIFARYSIELASALLSFSLAAGFSAPRLLSTLQETGYLTSNNREVTYRRLLETMQFVNDAMRDMMPLKGKGWRSAVRVRLLHAQARLRILEGRGKVGNYNIETDGIPINQEDLVATLGAFCVGPIWACRRLRVGLTAKEQMAYVAAWRHIGFYMGIEVGILKRHFCNLSAAEKLLACSAWHLFSGDDLPPGSDPYDTTTMRVLSAVTDRPPQASSLLHHVEMARRALGPGLSARLGLPTVPWRTKAHVSWRLFLIRCFTLFGRYYRRDWNVRRARLMQHVMVAITAWQLGRRRTRFVAKDPSEKDDPLDFEECDVQLGETAGREVGRRYRALIREMIVVLASLAILTSGLLFVSWRWFKR